MANDDDGPDDEESILIGICGILIFFFLLGLSILAFVSSLKHKYSKLIFGFAALMCIFELPRSIALIVQEDYHDQATYVLHMIANFFFFISFTFFCLLLREAIDLSKTSSPLRNKIFKGSTIESLLFTRYSLYFINFIFAVLVIVTSVYCILSSSLIYYFHHDISYKIYTYFDIAKNIVYSVALMYFGCRLRLRIKGFSKQVNVNQDSSVQEALILHRLEIAVRKLIIVMSICIVSFILRAIMLILKADIVEEDQLNLPGLPAYGMLWFWLSDYIPRMCPVLAFVYFLGNITPPKSLLFKFRLFSKEFDPNLQERLRNQGDLSVSMASTLYEEELSMNQITPSLRDFLTNEAAQYKEHRPSQDTEGEGRASSFIYGVGANSVTGGGDVRDSGGTLGRDSANARNSSVEPGGGTRASRNTKDRDNSVSNVNGSTGARSATSNSRTRSGFSPFSAFFRKSKSDTPSLASSNPLHLTESSTNIQNHSSVNDDEEKGKELHQHPLTESQCEKQSQLSDPDGSSSFWG